MPFQPEKIEPLLSPAAAALEFWGAAEREIRHGNAERGVGAVRFALSRIRAALGPARWRALARSAALAPLRAVLHEDPLSRRAWERPRGFACDAVTLDLVYRSVPPPPETAALGGRIYAATSGSECSRSVRLRRDHLTQVIEQVAHGAWRPRALAFGCAHLREAQRSWPVMAGRFGAFHAVDADAEALEVVASEQACFGVSPVHASLRDVLSGRLDASPSSYQLVYSLGTCEHLPRLAAESFARALFRLVAPGGTLLLCNLAPSNPDAAYLEAVMDWWPIHRDERKLLGLSLALPDAQVRSARAWTRGHVAYLEVRRS